MSAATPANKYIVLDTNIVIHFQKAKRLGDLVKIFPAHKIKILDIVEKELNDYKGYKEDVLNFIKASKVERITIESFGEEVTKEYFWIKKMRMKGPGESACLALARYNKDSVLLASSDYKDVGPYCDFQKMDFIGTMDFLCEALNKGVFSQTECDDFIKKVIEKRGRLPVTKMADHTCRSITHIISPPAAATPTKS